MSKKSKIQQEKENMKHLEAQLMSQALETGYILRTENSESLIYRNGSSKSTSKRKMQDVETLEAELKEVIATTRGDVDREVEYGDRIQGLGSGKNRRHFNSLHKKR